MKEIYRKIEREYENQRDLNEINHRNKVNEIYKEIPKIKKIDELIKTLSIESIKKQIISSSSKELIKINEDLTNLIKEKEDTLVDYGYPRDYLKMEYKCDICKDKGYLENGEKCNCLKGKLSKELYEISNLSHTLEKENFNTFDLSIFSNEICKDEGMSPRQNMENIYKISLNFIKNFKKDDDNNLLFFGPTGQGKTFMLNCIAKELLDQNFNVIYQTAFSMLDLIEDRRFRRNELNQAKYQMLFDAELLIIDDLGIEMVNSFSVTEIFNIVNTRTIKGRKTLISTNLSPKELSKTYTDRVFSRVSQRFVPVKFFGDDLRWKIN